MYINILAYWVVQDWDIGQVGDYGTQRIDKCIQSMIQSLKRAYFNNSSQQDQIDTHLQFDLSDMSLGPGGKPGDVPIPGVLVSRLGNRQSFCNLKLQADARGQGNNYRSDILGGFWVNRKINGIKRDF